MKDLMHLSPSVCELSAFTLSVAYGINACIDKKVLCVGPDIKH